MSAMSCIERRDIDLYYYMTMYYVSIFSSIVEVKPSVIIIDDEKDLVESILMYLEMNGIEVKGTGYDGCDAEKLYKQTHPDFVILDMNMPNYDGVYALQKIKEQDPNAKILVCTGFAEYNFEKNKVNQIFTKPLDPEKLLLKIKDHAKN